MKMVTQKEGKVTKTFPVKWARGFPVTLYFLAEWWWS